AARRSASSPRAPRARPPPRLSSCGASRRSTPSTAIASKATNDEGVSFASLATRDAAGCRRSWSASKSSPRGVAMTISPSSTEPPGSAASSASCSSGKYRSSGLRSRLCMNTSSALRKTIARKPSHLGSKSHPSPSGNSSASLASIGSIGGSIGNRPVVMAPAYMSRYNLCIDGGRGRASEDHSQAVGSARLRRVCDRHPQQKTANHRLRRRAHPQQPQRRTGSTPPGKRMQLGLPREPRMEPRRLRRRQHRALHQPLVHTELLDRGRRQDDLDSRLAADLSGRGAHLRLRDGRRPHDSVPLPSRLSHSIVEGGQNGSS